MDIGKISNKIEFWGYTSAPDGYGGTTDTDVLLLSTFAAIATVRPSAPVVQEYRQLQDNQVVSNPETRFTIRYRKGFTPTVSMRILYAGQQYTINSIDMLDPLRRFVYIKATRHE